jgi:type VI secretion system protein ImpH
MTAPSVTRRRAPGLLAHLLAQPRRFRFDAAVRVLMRARARAEPGEAVRFRTSPGLAYPPADILAITPREDGRSPEVTVGMGGLTGPSGVLPRFYTEQVVQQVRLGARGLHTFLDMLGHRMLAAFAAACIKYRPQRAAERAALGDVADAHRGMLLALVGEAMPTLARPREEQDALLHYAGLFAAWPRSAERLRALLSDWLGRPVTVEQFAGAWLTLPPSERTRLPERRDAGAFTRLGHDAAVGVRAWDAQARMVLRIGPLPLTDFRDLLPDRPSAGRLVAFARAFLGSACVFTVNPVLAGHAVPACKLGAGTRLGWDCWLPSETRDGLAARQGDAVDARFDAAAIERLQAPPGSGGAE